MRSVHTAGFTTGLDTSRAHPEIIVQSTYFDAGLPTKIDGEPFIALSPAEALALGSVLTELGRAGMATETMQEFAHKALVDPDVS